MSDIYNIMKNLEEYKDEELKYLDKQLEKYKYGHKMYIRILAVKMVKKGHSRKEVGEVLRYSRKTIGRWYNKYEKNGIDGLKDDYSNNGAECRLSDEQLIELRQILVGSDERYNIKKAQRLIKEKYLVDYTYKQVWVITRIKLNLNYREGNSRFFEAPEDAEENLHESLEGVDPETEDVVFVDESRCQNDTNTKRQLCEPTVDGVRDPNYVKRSGKRFGINAVGFQGINCNSYIAFNHRNNANNFVITLGKYALTRFNNPIVNKKISDAINDPLLLDTNIKLNLLSSVISKKEYDELYDIYNNLDYKKLNSLCKKYNINYYKINRFKRERLIHNFSDKKLMELTKYERKINIILDNAQIHKAKVTKIIAEILNINLIYLPPYCPFLNPIEKVWRDVKREMYIHDFETLNELIEVFYDEFVAIVDNTSYFEDWTIKFFGIIFW